MMAPTMRLLCRGVRLTQHPMPVDGLVVGQSPMPPAKIHRAGEMTIQV
jgi:hypothetical protein